MHTCNSTANGHTPIQADVYSVYIRNSKGGKVTVDIERTVEQDDECMEAYFDDAITYQWYRNYEAISGATGQSYTITEADAGEEISVTLTRTSDGKFLKSAKLTIPSSDVLKGDVNSDGTVDIYDAMRLFKFVNEEIDEL